MWFERFNISLGIEYADLSIVPRLSNIQPSMVSLQSRVTRSISASLPFIPSPMDSVTSYSLCAGLMKLGCVPILHPFYGNWTKGIHLISSLAALRDSSGGAIGIAVCPDSDAWMAVSDAVKAGVNILALDTLHHRPDEHCQAITRIKDQYPAISLISGNVVDGRDCEHVIELGADAVRVGFSSASINRGREITGCGRSQAAAVAECATVARSHQVPVIADGSIRTAADVAVALALGADTVMMGRVFAAMPESGALTESDFSTKLYTGMSRAGQIGVDQIAEGQSDEVKSSPPLHTVINEWAEVLRISISRGGAVSIPDLHRVARLEITLGRI
jgi:IMP dehydrogenase/GMP reductase